MKTFYTDYVNHILRFYIRHPECSRFRSEADKMNYTAAQKAFSKLTEQERSLLITVYTRYDTMGDNVYEAAKAHGIDQEKVWALINYVSVEIAKERKLIGGDTNGNEQQ